MNCFQHAATYKGNLAPKTECLDCWMFWLEKHPDESITGAKLFQILSLFRKEAEKTSNEVYDINRRIYDQDNY